MTLLHTYAHKGGELHLYAYKGGGPSDGGQDEASRLRVSAPGAGSFEFEGLNAGWQGDALELTVRIKGRNLGYLYTELLLKDQDSDRAYGPVSREYIRAERNDGSSGITRPVWQEDVQVTARLRPLLRLLTDGAHHALCFPMPEGYSSAGYRQGGLYTLAGETSPLRALLGFSADGGLKRAIAYPEHDRRGGARVLTPAQGDRFVPFAQALTPAVGHPGWHIDAALSDTLTLGSWPLRVVTEKAMPGEYLAGIVAQDLDGGLHRQYVPVKIGA